MTRRLAVLCAVFSLAPAGAGELTRRFDLALQRALAGGPPRYTSEFLLADLEPGATRRFAEFSGDLSGRYLGAMALAGPDALDAARSLAPRVFALQRADGGFGRPLSPSGASRDDMARLWGHGSLLVGLVEHYDATGDEQSLAAARRLGDFLLDHAGRFNGAAIRRAFQDGAMAHGYVCWTQNIEALALLAWAAGDSRYSDAALTIAEGLERRPGQHAHGWLSSLRGLVLLAENDASLLPRVERAWESFARSQDLLWTGGPPEYFDPGIARDEGCASADWVRLNLGLWRLTAAERYLQAAEDALFNALFANQLPNGGFGHLRLSADGFDYGAVEAWWCCTLHGARAFPDIRASAFRAKDGALHYDLPVDGRGEASGLVVEADAEPALEGRVLFRVLQAPAQPVALRVRKPVRTAELRSSLGSTREPWLEIARLWKAGDTLDVSYSFDWELAKRGDATIHRLGPWTLGVSEGGDPAAFNEAFDMSPPESAALQPADRPSRRHAAFHQRSYGGQEGQATLRPIAERWESGAHALRWKTLFGAPPPRPAAARISRYGKPAAAGFAAGLLFAAFIAWLLRRRRQRH